MNNSHFSYGIKIDGASREDKRQEGHEGIDLAQGGEETKSKTHFLSTKTILNKSER